MKLMFASDIHGSVLWCERLKNIYFKENAEKLILLGDLLYHGPRNDIPEGYNPKAVINILNGLKYEILCIRGNCDAEVDQMVLEFPIMADYAVMYIEGHTLFLTHGHVYNKENLPPIKKGDILLNGHTHILECENMGNYFYLNPGSVSIPKENNKNSYMIYEDEKFTIKDFEGNTLKEIEV